VPRGGGGYRCAAKSPAVPRDLSVSWRRGKERDGS